MNNLRILFILILFNCTANGQIKFQKSFLGSCHVTNAFMQQCSDSGYVIGSTTSFGIFVVRTNQVGDTVWTKMFVDTLRGDTVYPTLNCIRQISDNGFMITGVAYGDGYFMRLDSTGNKLWSNTFDNESDELYNVLEEDTGGFLISGYSNGPMGHDDGFYMSVNDSGHINSLSLHGTRATGVLNFVRAFDGGIVYAFDGIAKDGGTTAGFWVGTLGYPTVIVPAPDSGYVYGSGSDMVKIDSHGFGVWTINPGVGSILDMVYVNDPSEPGYALISMDTVVSFPDDDMRIYLTKTDTSGNVLWTKSYGGFTYRTSNLVYAKDGGFAIAGISGSIAENWAIILLKTDSMGNIQ